MLTVYTKATYHLNLFSINSKGKIMRKLFFFFMTFFIMSPAMNTIYAGDNLQFGYTAISLGSPLKVSPTIDDAFSGKIKGVIANHFYHIGGMDAQIVPTDARLFYDGKSLYLIFKCDNPNPNNGVELRDDRMALYINLNNDPSKHYEFSVKLRGQTTEGKYFTKNDTSAVRLSIPQAEVRIDKDKWFGKLEIPWAVIGGKPSGKFGLLLIRHKQQNSSNQLYTQADNQTAELSSPAAIDFYEPGRPGMYMEASFGGSPSIIRTSNHILTKLPSGKLFWQKNAILSMPDETERVAIWNMQNELSQPTTKENLASRIHNAQRWADLMILEGYGFASFIGLWNPSGENYYPWEARWAVNVALSNGNFSEACRVMDVFLKKLDIHSRKWFADESPGNVLKDEWTKVAEITNATLNNNEITLIFSAGNLSFTLKITASKIGGFRIHSTQRGFYNPETVAFSSIKESGNEIVVKNGEATAIINKSNNWSIVFKNSQHGTEKYGLRKGDISLRIKDGKIVGVDYSGALAPEEAIFGFGERFDAINQCGRILTLWDIDAWESTFKGIFNQMYKIIPLIHSSQGYSIYLNNSYRIRCDVGNQKNDRFRYTAHGPVFDVFVFTVPPMKAIQAINELTGKPILPPKWVYEPWMGGGGDRWMEGPSKNPTLEMINVVKKFAKLDIPHSSIYAEGSGNEDPLLHAALLPYGIRIHSWWAPWIIPIDKAKKLINVPDEELPFVRDASGAILQYPPEYKEMHDRNPHIDFFHPRALELIRADWKYRFDLGVAGSMVDFADLIQDESVFYNGKSGDEMHNIYCLEYDRKMHDVFKERRGDDHVLYSRAAFSGSQAYLCQFAGDHQSNFYGLTAAIKGNLSISTVGFSNIGCDVGGYIGRADQETYMRWVEYGAFSPIMRCHGTMPREPWEYNDSTVRLYKKMVWTRENFLDYIYSNAVNTNITGIPMTRTLQMSYPGIKEYLNCTDEYFFGPDLLVAPIHDYGDIREVFFPKGRWTNIWTNKCIDGPVKQAVTVPLDRIAVYLSSGALIPANLNKTLTWGESMTLNKVPVLIVTPPDSSTTSICWPEKDQKVVYTSEPTNEGFVITTNGRADTRYLIIYGSQKIKKVKMENEEIPSLTGNQLQSLPIGWYEDNQGRIIIRLSYKQEHRIEIIY
jgi:alpha-glucosidase (family GH31 glycosyl hydrolase)